MTDRTVDDLQPGKPADDWLSADDAHRLRDVLQRYARCPGIVKTRFLRRVLTASSDPSLSYLTKTIFGRLSAKVVSHDAAEDDLTFNTLPTDEYARSLDAETLRRTMDNDFEWIRGLSERGRLVVFVRLMLSGGTDVVTTIVDHVDHSIGEKQPSLRKLIGKYTGIRNRMAAATRKSSTAAAFTNGSSDGQRIPFKSNLDKYRVADSARRDYAKRTDEWENKLDSFYQKHRTEPGGSRSALKAPLFYGRAPKLPVWTGVPFGRQELLPADDCRAKTNGRTLTDEQAKRPFLGHVQRTPGDGGRTSVNAEHRESTPADAAISVGYEQARRFIDKHVKTVTSEWGQFEYDNEEISPVANLSDDRKIEKELSKTLRTAEGIVAELVAMVPRMFCEDALNHRTFPQPKATL